MKKAETYIIMLIVAVILISGCTAQQDDGTDITIKNHPVVYSFLNPVREVLLYNVSDKFEIRNAVLSSSRLTIIFDGSSAEDDAYFQTVLYNLVTKIQTYFVYEGRIMNFDTFYYMGDQWYNGTEKIPEPGISGTKLLIKGPNTNATGNSVSFSGSTIYLQGTSYKNLTLAGDRLALLVMGIDSVK